MPLNIKDNEAHSLARKLAEATGESLTQAVKISIQERLAPVRHAHAPRLAGQLDCIALDCAGLPVLDPRTPDEILGVLLAKDLLKFFGNGSEFDIHAILRPAVLIPESMRLNVLLAEFRRSRNHMALVVDEYGGVAGLITIEDVLEQIVGEIDDEHDDEEEPALIHAQADGSWLVSALTPIEDFNEDVGATFSDEEFDTIGGLITAEFGHLPEAGEEAVAGEFLFHVTEADDRRVQQFRVTRRANDA